MNVWNHWEYFLQQGEFTISLRSTELLVYIVNGLIPYNRLDLYITGNAFSWKMIIGKVWALIVNFALMKHGGAHGGAESFWWLMKLSDLPKIREIVTFLRLQEGRSRRGEWRGVKMEGRVVGRFLVHMVGRWRGAQSTHRAFYTQKKVIFVIECLIDAQWRAPRLPPLHKSDHRIL